MSDGKKAVGIFVLLVVVFGLEYFAPKHVQVQRDNSSTLSQFMIHELQKMQFDYYTKKDPEAKEVLMSTILHRVSGYNLYANDPVVPPNLRSFIDDLKQECRDSSTPVRSFKRPGVPSCSPD